MTITRKIVLVLTLLLILPLSGCFDLGDYESNNELKPTEENFKEYYQSYYDSFDDIYLIDSDKESESYDLCDSFFNPSTINHFEWEDDDYEVPSLEYIYMAIETDRDLIVSSVSCSIKTEQAVKFEVGIIIKDDYSFDDDDICGYDDDIFERNSQNAIVKDNNGNNKLKEFEIPQPSQALGLKTVTTKENMWSSFVVSIPTPQTVEDGDYIIIVFYNNTGYGKSLDSKAPLTKVKFQITNLLVRAEKPE